MQIDTSLSYLPIYEALASKIRLQVIEMIRTKELSVKDLAQACGVSSAIMSMHVKKLEQAGLIQCVMKRINGGTYKFCSLLVPSLVVDLAGAEASELRVYETSVPIGHYTDFCVLPTCGIATREKLIGQYDDPRCFLDPERVNAHVLWFTKGFVEYKIPNYIKQSEHIREIEISFEISSEAPRINENWLSDIAFSLNGKELGNWTSPGDFGLTRGRFTPEWWHEDVNQYGLLKRLKVTAEGTYMDEERISDVGLSMVEIDRNQWTLRMEVSEARKPAGGITLFGSGFGNYDQDIVFRISYDPGGANDGGT
ncbi:helix-turn-helix domain-containing protein [Paenibacillus sp. sptzw28]|uniref:ArsR/SmtB family transcription factor n=1 Tax=Paenibacillus sp. sptzw28 TaxID=715179 RepID=UPI001C6E5FBE|nr:helix-turn-helix domain-containing protein [Paenibacillus sp. sptzw28]QYR22749.1 helix-turn-helix domain-containing protein [Paenibacillus sp. sptzw28]